MKVKATKLGYYDNKRQRPGAVFYIESKDHFSEKWMELIEDKKKPAKKKKVKKEPKEEVVLDSNSEVI